MHDMNDMLHTWKTKSHKSIYECIIFYVKKIQICVVIKKIWFGLEKLDLFFVYVKKIVFGIEKSDICLLNKTKSFGFKKKKKSDLFLRTRKIGFWFVLKKIRSIL